MFYSTFFLSLAYDAAKGFTCLSTVGVHNFFPFPRVSWALRAICGKAATDPFSRHFLLRKGRCILLRGEAITWGYNETHWRSKRLPSTGLKNVIFFFSRVHGHPEVCRQTVAGSRVKRTSFRKNSGPENEVNRAEKEQRVWPTRWGVVAHDDDVK